MRIEDHLDKETSVSAEVTPTGVKAIAKSRFIAAIDRLGGNLAELMNAPMEAWTAEKRARSDARVRAIEAMTEIGLDQLRTDREFAERAIRGHLESIFVERQNKDAVLGKAIEDLRRQPPTEAEATSGPETLDETFTHRFERYAGSATTDELREKWGRVLAAEVRRPNTFSAKVLRTVDEIDPETATLFEKVCEHRLDNVLVKCLVGELSFEETVKLTEAGLLVEPGFSGQVRQSTEVTSNKGVEIWFWNFEILGLALIKDSTIGGVIEKQILKFEKGSPMIPVYVLTDVGKAISSILPNHTASAIEALVAKLSESAPQSPVMIYKNQAPRSSAWTNIKTIPAKSPPQEESTLG
ncbi:DUF2806 domain-containing protein [Mesorhizobium amorphae]|uniref:DUF2806 domain-containing protein n=1 Tax=Mesorhizobium amorphae TaxID=71433 RepID=UPI00178223ED|nr:DUF2806 domain-containing protein [Mesorhizobium amorphae]